MDCSGKLCKGIWGSLVLLGVMWLLLVGDMKNGEKEMKLTVLNAQDHHVIGSMKNTKVIRTEKRNIHPKIDFISKRGVPNGHDPIHNRRAGSSRPPPGQSSKGELGNP
ncbi:CLAVATA3/ESR (CLE)-related protein 25-like [Lycium ferocissimum]|uniref:CLAVATA3/ESR (CLE)-related protein 25-like n=1 Tax=Lycium ferocissimum TaxID=112874 RepID=UPI002815D93A|nr:CLAVATA3/ESR (CLE)-related protein 25-like [Lycium ferocissimum]